MSTKYFKKFDKIYYTFGDETSPAIIQDLSTYVDLIDQIKSNNAFYEDYTIVSGERPDTTSFKLYGTTDYYWTFFLLNDQLREQGWPITRSEVLEQAAEYYPHITVTTQDSDLPSYFPVGQRVIGQSSLVHGEVLNRNLDLGQLVIDVDNSTIDSSYTDLLLSFNSSGYATVTTSDSSESFRDVDNWLMYQDSNGFSDYSVTLSDYDRTATIKIDPDIASDYHLDYFTSVKNPSGSTFSTGELLTYTDNSGTIRTVQAGAVSPQYLSTHHYEDSSGTPVDIVWTTPEISGLTQVTYADRMEAAIEEVRIIKVIKPESIETIAQEFYNLIEEGL